MLHLLMLIKIVSINRVIIHKHIHKLINNHKKNINELFILELI